MTRLLPELVGEFADAVDRDGDRIDRLLHDADPETEDQSPSDLFDQ